MIRTTHRKMLMFEDKTQAVENKDEVRRDTMSTVALFNFYFLMFNFLTFNNQRFNNQSF
jgi:hypothetical protein